MADRRVTADDPRRIEYALRLRAARLARGLTQKQVGDLLGVTKQYVTNLESGYRVESWPNWLAMVTTLDYDPRIVAPELCGPQTDGSADESDTDLNTADTPQPVDVNRSRPKRNQSTNLDS